MSLLEKEAERQEEENLDDLAAYVMDCFDRARRHRDDIGVTEAIIDSLRRFRGKYTHDELQKFQGVAVYRGLTGMLVRSAFSWLKDAYFNAQDRPWTLDPTPEPELPETIAQELKDSIEFEIANSIGNEAALQGMPSQQSYDFIAQLKNSAQQMAQAYAGESAKGMTKVIEDQLLEASFRDTLSEHLLDVSVFPYAVLKGPIIRRRKIPVWSKNRYTFKEEPRYDVDRVNPINFFASPDSTNTQDGEFVIELMPMSRARLNEAKRMKDFSKTAINLVIAEADHAYQRQAQLRVDDGEQTSLDGVGRSDTKLQGSMFDVYEYNGRIPGEYLIDYMEDEDKLTKAIEKFDTVDTDWGMIDPYEDYESTIWVCNNTVIFARLNKAQPIPYRPYYVTSAFKIPGSLYGECIPMVIADLQDELNTAARARMFNMGMASGPIVEADISRFRDGEVPENIRPWSVYPVTTDSSRNNNSAPALRFTNVPDTAATMTAVMDEVWEKAHRVSGIPPYMYGDSQGAAQTLGAFSLQYAAATKGIKTIISNIDNDVVEKLIQQMYYYNMYYHDDESIKADARVNVRGAAGLIAQEQRQARPLELLQALGPILAQMDPETALALANETLSESGYDKKTLGKSGIEKEASNRLIQNSAQPQPDGRSGNVENQLANAQMPAPPPL